MPWRRLESSCVFPCLSCFSCLSFAPSTYLPTHAALRSPTSPISFCSVMAKTNPSFHPDRHDSSPVLSPVRPDTTRRLRTRSSHGNPQLRPPARPLPPLKRARSCPRGESRSRLPVKFGRPTTGCRMSSGEIRLSDRMRPVRLAVGGSTLGGGRSGPSGVSRGGRRRACGWRRRGRVLEKRDKLGNSLPWASFFLSEVPTEHGRTV